MKRYIRRPSPAVAFALLALFVALGGTGWAAIRITGKSVKNGSLTGRDLKRNSLTGRQIRESRLGGVLRGSTAKIRAASVPVGANATNGNYNSSAVSVGCGPGEIALSAGSGWGEPTENLELATVYSRLTLDPSGKPTGATARGSSDIPALRTFTVFVFCAKG